MIPGSANPLLLKSAAAAAAGGYQIERSLRFNSSDSAFLSRTPASAGNRKTWTWAGWVKRSALDNPDFLTLFSCRIDSSNYTSLFTWRNSENDLGLFDVAGGSQRIRVVTSQVFRDLSAWCHILCAVDTTAASSTDRVKLYVNGTLVSALSSSTYGSQNIDTQVNNSSAHHIGRWDTIYSSAYLADVFFIDGQALDPSSFVETSATTGQLIPKAYTGSFGTNGFWLKFSDNSAATATTLGKDYSGNSNNWTPNNLSVTAGAGNDSLVDSPSSILTDVDNGLGGEVRGNYCTLNSVDSPSGKTFSNGNLEVTSNDGNAYGTMAVSSGKWYWEVRSGGVQGEQIGIADANALTRNSFSTGGWSYDAFQGRKVYNNTYSGYGSALSNGDIVGIALNMDAGEITFYRNGVSQGVAFNTNISGKTIQPMLERGSGFSMSWVCNFGQRPFAYTAPSGFKALCDTNLPAPVVAKPSTVFNVITYTGTGSSLTLPNGSSTPTSISFTPDWVWIKGRSGATDHALYDAVRGVEKDLVSNSTAAETTQTTGLTAFGTNTFTVGSLAKLNTSSSTYVAWAWDAGTTTASNTQGSITSQVRANVSAGFSIVTFTAQSSGNATIGHGLGVEPHMIIVKSRAGTYSWLIYHKALTSNAYYLILNSTAAQDNTSNAWNSTTPTSTVFTLGSTYAGGGNSVAYCFTPVVGYSSMGSYLGNGSSDGPFIYTGFRPRWILLKESSASGNNWFIYDTARNTFNVCQSALRANLSAAELTTSSINFDILSNGFKPRNSDSFSNGSGSTYIYAAFAENPFQYARAR